MLTPSPLAFTLQISVLTLSYHVNPFSPWPSPCSINPFPLGLHLAEFSAHTKHTYHVLDGLQETVFDASTTSTALNVSVSATLTELMKKVEDIDKRLKKIESHPQGVLMEQIESVDHKVLMVFTTSMYIHEIPGIGIVHEKFMPQILY